MALDSSPTDVGKDVVYGKVILKRLFPYWKEEIEKLLIGCMRREGRRCLRGMRT